MRNLVGWLSVLLMAAGCSGRYTGSSAIVDEEGNTLARITLNNVTAADCNEDGLGVADTFKGAFQYSDGEQSFTCTVSTTSLGGTFGFGLFYGTVSRYRGFEQSPPGTCGVVLLPAGGSWLASVCFGGNCEEALQGVGDCLESEPGNPLCFASLFQGGNVSGFTDNGNIQYHRVNTQGVCPPVL